MRTYKHSGASSLLHENTVSSCSKDQAKFAGFADELVTQLQSACKLDDELAIVTAIRTVN